MALSTEQIAAYNKSRINSNKPAICLAPSSSMNFEQGGAVTACCYNRQHTFGTYPKESLYNMWFGKAAQHLRNAMTENDLSQGCYLCEQQIVLGNYANTLAKGFDVYDQKKDAQSWFKWDFWRQKTEESYPKVLEFELDNTCNLECKMCSGKFSSLIRKNREKLPPLENVYDDQFVDQLDQFLPHIKEAKFLGGEPFLIPIYWKIWDRILQINPSIKVHITTNGTILSSRIKNLLSRLKPNLIISIDSMTKDNYEHIRENANFDMVWRNVEYFLDYTRSHDKDFSFAVCPMTLNWQEMPSILDYCNKNNIGLYFNTVTYPLKYSLHELHPTKLNEVILRLDKIKHNPAGLLQRINNRAYDSFIYSLKNKYAEILATHSTIVGSYEQVIAQIDKPFGQLLLHYNIELFKYKTSGKNELEDARDSLFNSYDQLLHTPVELISQYINAVEQYCIRLSDGSKMQHRVKANLEETKIFLGREKNLMYLRQFVLMSLHDIHKTLTTTTEKEFKQRLGNPEFVEQWLSSRSMVIQEVSSE